MRKLSILRIDLPSHPFGELSRGRARALRIEALIPSTFHHYLHHADFQADTVPFSPLKPQKSRGQALLTGPPKFGGLSPKATGGCTLVQVDNELKGKLIPRELSAKQTERTNCTFDSKHSRSKMHAKGPIKKGAFMISKAPPPRQPRNDPRDPDIPDSKDFEYESHSVKQVSFTPPSVSSRS